MRNQTIPPALIINSCSVFGELSHGAAKRHQNDAPLSIFQPKPFQLVGNFQPGLLGILYNSSINIQGGIGPYSHLQLSIGLPLGLLCSIIGTTVNITGTLILGGVLAFDITLQDSTDKTCIPYHCPGILFN